ncbi:uncharacterized protein TM35_000083300 [Trypanosoma theileri]|uniref:MYND-type domain-containing protein n=1 Tax=Trypanosoma theileri TaxID=67003 RepID=A0A1X0P0U4_9TRYP|nr:uncharacterized protein TM35_000083300 [Trypanosoma theileri]ORC90532.1 hypothetical protein TM35_000083300 [Trypanosoma theileri]
MKCVTCLCVSDTEGENDIKCSHFIPCPQCLKLLYCSASCAEVGWYGHRYFCDASLNKSSTHESLVKKHQEFWQQRQQEEKLKKWLKYILHCLVFEKDSEPPYEILLSLLNTLYSFNDMNTCIINENLSLLIKEVSINLETVFSQTVSPVGITIFVLLQAKFQSLFLRDHDTALNTLLRGLAKIILRGTPKEVSLLQQVLEDERMNLWTRKYSKVIMTTTEVPRSSQRLMCGEVVAVNSIPFLSWKSSNFPSVLCPRQSSLYDEGLKSMCDSFINLKNKELTFSHLMDDEREAISILLVEELPSVQYMEADVVVSSSTYLTLLTDTPSLSLPCWLISLFFSAVISRRRFKSDMWGFFELVSRLRHSCKPNCIWNSETGELKALREIAPHEPLTMDTIWASLIDTTRQMMMMKLPTHLRQKSIRTNIGILCSCERCTGKEIYFHYPTDVMQKPKLEKEGIDEEEVEEERHTNDRNAFDFLRGFACPLCRIEEGWRYRQQYQDVHQQPKDNESNQSNRLELKRYFTPYEPWVCHSCKEKWRDCDLPLERETELSRKAERLLLMASRNIIGKGFFEELKTLMQDILHVMGRQHHSVYLLGCEAFILFYRYIATRFSSTTSLLAQKHIIAWCRKWIRCAQNTLLIINCPHVYSAFIVETALSLSSVSLLREKVILLRHAEIHCPAAVINGTNSTIARAVADILYNTKSPEFTKMAQSPSLFAKFMEEEEQEWEDALISEWESHLMDRVHTELNSNAKPNLPTKLLHIIPKKE